MTSSTSSPAPMSAIAGVTPHSHRLRVIDAQTGEIILGVREADAATGQLIRNKLDDKGNLIIQDDKIVTVEETRAIRIVWDSDLPKPPVEETPAAEPVIVPPPEATLAPAPEEVSAPAEPEGSN